MLLLSRAPRLVAARPPSALAVRAGLAAAPRWALIRSRSTNAAADASIHVQASVDVPEHQEDRIVITDAAAQVMGALRRTHATRRAITSRRAHDPRTPCLREQRILELNQSKGVSDPALQRLLRLSVEPGGCSGFSYKFDLEEPSTVDSEEDM